MAKQYLTGYDGYFTFGAPTAQYSEIRAWSGDFSRVVSDVTDFGATGRRRRLGIFDVTGSANGVMSYDAASTAPGINATDWSRDGMTLTLGVLTATTVCSYTVTAVFSNIAISSDKTGDASITFNFMNSGGTLPTETWDES